MEQLTKTEQQEVDYRQLTFPMRRFHKISGAVRVFFGLDEWLMHESNYVETKPVIEELGPAQQLSRKGPRLST